MSINGTRSVLKAPSMTRASPRLTGADVRIGVSEEYPLAEITLTVLKTMRHKAITSKQEPT